MTSEIERTFDDATAESRVEREYVVAWLQKMAANQLREYETTAHEGFKEEAYAQYQAYRFAARQIAAGRHITK